MCYLRNKEAWQDPGVFLYQSGMGNVSEELSSAKTSSHGTLVYTEKEEEKLLSPFYSSRYFSPPQDFPGCISFPRTRH